MAVMTENEQTIAELNEAYEHTRDKLTAERAENARLRAELERLLRDQGSALQSAMLRIERQEAELAKPEDARLRDVIEALDRRAVMLESPGDRVRWILRELDEWITRAGAAERERYRLRKLFDDAGQGGHTVECE